MTSKFPTSLTKFYTEEELLKAFGTVTPTLAERTDFFDGLWFAFIDNTLDVRDLTIPDGMSNSDFVSMLRKEFGPFNVVRRGLRMRFRNPEDAVYIKLKYSK